MHVLYDISTVGDKTGLGRWVRELALEFPRRDDCHVTFCATGSPWGVASAAKFLREHPDFDGAGLAAAGIAQRMVDASAALAPTPGGGRQPMRRLTTFMLAVLMRGVNSAINKVPAPLLANADIFNSPYGRLTAQSKRAPRIQRFLTVHDLLPRIMPEVFTPGQCAVHERIINSIGPQDWVVCVSESTRNDLCRLTRVRREQTVVIYPGSNSDRFQPCADAARRALARTKYGIPAGPYLLSVATLEPRKNLAFLVRCFARWARETRNHDLNLVLVGGRGWKYQSLLETIAGLAELRGRVTFAGFVDEDDLAPLYSDCLAFVYPSLYEGFGSPVLEALKCGAAIITSATSSLPELVGDAGILIDPRDEDSLCQALDHVYNDAGPRARLSSRAIERARGFSWSKCVEQHLAAFRHALASRIT